MGPCKAFTKEHCEKVLERYTGHKNFNIKGYWINPLHSQLDGLLSEQFFLKIQYQIGDEENTVQLFFKTLSNSNPIMYQISRDVYAFEKEAFYYEKVVPLLKSKGLRYDYVPQCYFSEDLVIVLEDLSKRSLGCTPKNKPLDLQHCRKCMEILAEFHTGPIIYELAKGEELGRSYSLNEDFGDVLEDKVFSGEDNGATKFMQCSIKGLFFLLDLIPENGISKADFKIALQAVLDGMLASKDKSTGFRSTLIHGDLWSNNFLFRYENGEIVECVLIDFQTLHYGPPAFDILQFFLTNTRKSFRDQHQEELLRHYYKSFSGLLAERGFQADTILSESDFLNSCKDCALPAKIQSVVDRSITFLSDEDHLGASQNEEVFSKYLYEDRGKYIVNGFNKNEEYKELMIEDVTELRDMIFARQL